MTAGGRARAREASPPAPVADVDDEGRRRIRDLVLQNQGLVHNIAWQVHHGCRQFVEIDDLIQAGNVGLAQAAARYDPSKAQFSTYAYYRIRGEIRDFVERQAWSRQRSRAELARGHGEEILETTTTDAALAEESGHGCDRAWLRSAGTRLALGYFASLASPEARWAEAHLGNDEDQPAEAQARREMLDALKGLIDRLPAQAADLIRMAYFEGLTLQDAGARLGMHKATASRLHAKTLDRLAVELRRIGAGET